MMGIASPALLLGLLLATIYAAAFHVWGGHSLRDLATYWLAACVGFGAGQLLGQLTQIPLLQIGRLYTVEGTVGALVALIVARAWSQSVYAEKQEAHK